MDQREVDAGLRHQPSSVLQLAIGQVQPDRPRTTLRQGDRPLRRAATEFEDVLVADVAQDLELRLRDLRGPPGVAIRAAARSAPCLAWYSSLYPFQSARLNRSWSVRAASSSGGPGSSAISVLPRAVLVGAVRPSDLGGEVGERHDLLGARRQVAQLDLAGGELVADDDREVGLFLGRRLELLAELADG